MAFVSTYTLERSLPHSIASHASFSCASATPWRRRVPSRTEASRAVGDHPRQVADDTALLGDLAVRDGEALAVDPRALLVLVDLRPGPPRRVS